MKYEKALKIIEKFNIDTGLRDFCTNKCKGSCCLRCPDRCVKYNERRIACSIFFCPPILITLFPGKDERFAYKTILNDVKSHIKRYIDAPNIFYHHPNRKEMDNIRKSEFPDSIREIELLDTSRIYKIVSNISNDQVHYFQNRERDIQEDIDKKRIALIRFLRRDGE